MAEMFFIWGVISLFCGALGLMGLLLELPFVAKVFARIAKEVFR